MQKFTRGTCVLLAFIMSCALSLASTSSNMSRLQRPSPSKQIAASSNLLAVTAQMADQDSAIVATSPPAISGQVQANLSIPPMLEQEMILPERPNLDPDPGMSATERRQPSIFYPSPNQNPANVRKLSKTQWRQDIFIAPPGAGEFNSQTSARHNLLN